MGIIFSGPCTLSNGIESRNDSKKSHESLNVEPVNGYKKERGSVCINYKIALLTLKGGTNEKVITFV